MFRADVVCLRCCIFVSCVHPVAVFNDAFCMTCSLLMLVEDAIGDHMEEAYSRAGLVVCENPSMLLYSIVMSYVNCGDDGYLSTMSGVQCVKYRHDIW